MKLFKNKILFHINISYKCKKYFNLNDITIKNFKLTNNDNNKEMEFIFHLFIYIYIYIYIYAKYIQVGFPVHNWIQVCAELKSQFLKKILCNFISIRCCNTHSINFSFEFIFHPSFIHFILILFCAMFDYHFMYFFLFFLVK